MAASERDFARFRVGDNPYELGNGAVPRLAGLTGITLSEQPTTDEIQEKLFANWGTEKLFRDNASQYKQAFGQSKEARRQVAKLIDQSGINWSIEPRNIAGDEAQTFRRVVVAGGVYNWMLRRTKLVMNLIDQGHRFDGVVLLAGSRPMTAGTEVGVDWVKWWQEDHKGTPPTEKDYLHHTTAVALRDKGLIVEEVYDDDPKAGFKKLVTDASDLLDGGEVLLSQNAPASSTFGDMRGTVPDELLYFAADGIPVAITDDQEKDSLHFQNAFSAPSALARWVKTIHDINQTV